MIFVVNTVSGQQLKSLSFIKPSAALSYTHLSSNSSYTGLAVIPGNYYALHIGFVCKRENLLEKFSGIPLRFRLGSITCNNRLEGKTVPITSD